MKIWRANLEGCAVAYVAGPGCGDGHESWDCLEDTPLERRISVSLSVSDYTIECSFSMYNHRLNEI